MHGGADLFVLALIGAALAAESYWWTEPVVVGLEPAGPQYVERHRQLMDNRTSGRGANPSFRTPWTRMDAHWAMVSGGSEGLLLSEDEMDQYRDLALLAALTAGQDLANETIDRSDMLRGVRTAMRSVTAPSLQIQRNKDGETTVEASGAPAMQRQDMINAAIAEPGCPVDEDERYDPYDVTKKSDRSTVGRPNAPRPRLPPPPPPPRPAFNVGMAGGAMTSAAVEDPTNVSLTAAWSAYAQARNVGVDALRVSGNVMQYNPMADKPVSRGALTVTARERFLPRWTGLATARSTQGMTALDVVQPAIAWQVFKTDPTWYLQTQYTHGLQTQKRPEALQQATVRLYWTSRWASPSSPDHWPLGQRPGAGGPVWPEDLAPQNQVVELVQTPAERYADAAPTSGFYVQLE